MNQARGNDLVNSTMDPAYYLALRLTGNESDAWDLTQDAMTKALKALPRFRGESSMRSWVYRIVVNTWKDNGASRPVQFRSRLQPLENVSMPGKDRLPEDILESDEFKERFASALASLEEEERHVLVLRELDGLTYREISESLHIPIGTVKSRLSRARHALRAVLEPSLLILILLSLAVLSIFRPHLTSSLRRVLAVVTMNK